MNTGFYALQCGRNRRQGSKAFSVKMDQDISLALFLWARSLQTYKKYLFVLSVCVRGTFVPQHVCRGQRTIWCGQLSPSTMRVSHSKPSCQASQPSQQDFNQRMQLQEVLCSRYSGYLPEIHTNQPGLVVHAYNLSTSRRTRNSSQPHYTMSSRPALTTCDSKNQTPKKSSLEKLINLASKIPVEGLERRFRG